MMKAKTIISSIAIAVWITVSGSAIGAELAEGDLFAGTAFQRSDGENRNLTNPASPQLDRHVLPLDAAGTAGFALTAHAGDGRAADSGTSKRGFQRRGFYLHGCWVMNHPFSVRSWEQSDFAAMFRLLRHLRYNTVMLWPTPETAPMPLSAEDAATLRGYRSVIGDAKAAGLECWFTYCPNVISKEEVRSLPWKERSLYASTQIIRLSDETVAKAYLEHRQSVLRLLDNADAFVVIDGDPGGYPGAPVEEYLRILKNDQQAVPGKRIIPWLWNGWGRDTSGGYWRAPVSSPVRASLEALKQQMTGEWELLPGRSHREGWANGRVPVAETEKAGLMSRSTIMCYEAIEFEPTPPAAVLQFDLIRRVLKQESRFANLARGVFGNGQTPVLVLPNLYFFGRGAADLSYLEKPDREVLADLARELGDSSGTLVSAWSCLTLSLPELPADLADKVRALRLATDLGKNIPGGPARYVEILAAQVDSRRTLLEAVAAKPGNPEQAAGSLVKGAAALLRWWQVHRYVGMGRYGDPFKWDFIHPSQVAILKQHARACAVASPDVVKIAAPKLAETGLLSQDEALARLQELIR
jgi:hypothetical protein